MKREIHKSPAFRFRTLWRKRERVTANPEYPTTYDILLDRAVRGTDCKRCVDWAIGLLLQGKDSDYVCRLAGQVAPFDSFTVSELRDRALHELGFEHLDDELLICHVLARALIDAIDDRTETLRILRLAREYFVTHGYDSLRMLYLLSHGLEEFAEYGEQWYIPEMDDANRESKTCQIIEEFTQRFANLP